MIRTLSIFALIALMLFVAIPAFAQDVPLENPTIDQEQARALLDELLASAMQAVGVVIAAATGIATGLFGGAPITQALVAFLKRILPLLPDVPVIRYLRNLEARSLNVGISFILTALAFGSAYLGYSLQFKGVIDFLTTLLPYLAGLIATVFGAQGLFEFLRRRNVPFFGYQRSMP